jgi:hypothetical protein
LTTHYVKSWTHLFAEAVAGTKTHDMRDGKERDYKVGDTLILQEFDFTKGQYTGREQPMLITYITSNMCPCAMSSVALMPGYIIISMKKISNDQDS